MDVASTDYAERLHPATPRAHSYALVGSAVERATKRAIDVVGAAIGLALASPLFAYIALRIKLDSPGPVLFRQERLTAEERPFEILKFRTMHVGTTSDAHRAYIQQSMLGEAWENDEGLYKLQRSEVTRFGAWLRRTSLDELPQLVNVLRGDMSLVGPRPCLAYEREYFDAHHLERFRTRAGITGLWQACERGRADFRQALDLDVEYVRRFSVWQDLKLLVLTVPAVLSRKGSV